MAKERIPKTIFFIKGIAATEDELAEIAELGAGVVIRSAIRTHPGEAIEPFDAVKGAVPEHYAKSDGKPKEFLTKRAKKLARIEAERGDADKPAAKREKAVPQRRAAAKPIQVPSAADPAAAGPQGAGKGGWGAPPAGAGAGTPTPPATPPAWKPNA